MLAKVSVQLLFEASDQSGMFRQICYVRTVSDDRTRHCVIISMRQFVSVNSVIPWKKQLLNHLSCCRRGTFSELVELMLVEC